MTNEEFKRRLVGRVVVDVEFEDEDALGDPPGADEAIVTTLMLDDGSLLRLSASPQIDYDNVFARLDHVRVKMGRKQRPKTPGPETAGPKV